MGIASFNRNLPMKHLLQGLRKIYESLALNSRCFAVIEKFHMEYFLWYMIKMIYERYHRGAQHLWYRFSSSTVAL